MTSFRLAEAETAAFADWYASVLAAGASDLDKARAIAARLGAHPRGAHPQGGLTEVAFWVPELTEAHVPDGDIFLELLEPVAPLDLAKSHQTARFRRERLRLARQGDHVFGVVEGMRPGTRETVGTFYALGWRDGEDRWHRILDPMAHSLPFGAMAPAELYDLASIEAGRGDRAYWQGLKRDDVVKLGPVGSILQVHVPSATAGGTLRSLASFFAAIAAKVEAGQPLRPEEEVAMGYEAVQLLPVEPTTVYEAGPPFWADGAEEADGTLTVELRRPDTKNWGYDVVIAGSAAVNPTLLESGRPDELSELAAVLHTFPKGPIRLVLDVVYGHADNQALGVLNPRFFSGPNMYGQDLNYRQPMVRAILLEMQRRKVNYGADGVRVDGAQDFKWWDAANQVLRHDDAFLQEMSDLVQEVAGCRFRPWMIFEDGRPWPEEDWELSSTYRAVIEAQRDDDVFQWGPLTFAHNTPFLYTFWLQKWWRIRQILEVGSHWISGCANHDTLRRGTQVSPKLNINTRLGSTRMEILDKAYNNPAVNLLTHAFLPGVPMDFLNANMRASWGFIRTQDDRYGVKVVAEEAISLDWQVDDVDYDKAGNFRRLKGMGFETLDSLRRFMKLLPGLVEVTDYDIDAMAKLMNAVEPPLEGPGPIDVPTLKTVARAWMEDMHEFCNVSHYADLLNPRQTAFDLAARRFRLARPWLRGNLGPADWFDYLRPVEGHVVFAGLRRAPDGSEAVFLIANMEGKPVTLDPARLDRPGVSAGGWHVALRTPPIGSDYLGGEITLNDSMGVVFTRSEG